MTDHDSRQTPHLVVGIDGSEHSATALAWAVRYASLIGASIEVITAWSYPVTLGISGIPSNWHPADDARQSQADTIAKVLGTEVPATLTRTVREGYPAQVLLDATKDAQMLIVGSRGHGGFAGMLLGSVSANCAEHARCPVLVMHAPSSA
jgi:nucleotide-binding universal stress UspA family protein